MKRFAVILVASLALAGCNPSFPNLAAGVSAVMNFKVNQDQVDAARAAWTGGFLVPATAYVRLPRCAAGTSFTIRNQCSEPARVRQIQSITRTMQANFSKVQTLVDRGESGSGVQTAWTALTSAIDTYKSVIATFTQG